MSSGRRCPRCLAPLQQGLCPACVLEPGGDDSQLGARPLWEDLGETGGEFQIIDQYAVRRRIARGGMGEVYLARQLSTGREVALKWLFPGIPADRVRREVAALAELDHPGIVKILHCGEHAGRAYLAMDLVDGPDAAQRGLQRPFTVEETAECMEQVARAIAHAHQRGVLHRDLKPQNILIGSDGAPRVTDFGLARRLDDATVTRAGERPGTPGYMAPEQVDSRLGRTTTATDVYGLGATLYHLLTGEAPFRAAQPEAVYQLVLHSAPTPPRVLNPRIPRELEALCLRCLEKAPRRRLANAGEVADALERYLTRNPLSLTKRLRRRLPVLGIALVLGVVAATVLIPALRPHRPQQTQEPRPSGEPPQNQAASQPINRYEFPRSRLYASELAGGMALPIRRFGDTNSTGSIRIRTVGGTAVLDRDFMRPDSTIVFAPGVVEMSAGVPIWDNAVPNPDRTVLFGLSDPTPGWTADTNLMTLTILDNDTPEGAGPGVAGGIRGVATDPEGRMLFAGGFNNALGAPAFSAFRMTREGRLDLSFQSGPGPDGWVNGLGLTKDRAVLLIGHFTRFNDSARARCVLLGPEGQFDSAFNASPGPDDAVFALALQPDGKWVISGDFLHVNEVPQVRLARLHPDGTLDETFQPGPGMTSRGMALAVQPDGKILVGGEFHQFGGLACSGLFRLLPDGSVDRGFKLSAVPSPGVNAIVIQPDGRILIGGWFSRYLGEPRALVARLLPDGNLDETFRPDWEVRGSLEAAWNPNPHVRHIHLLPDGSMVVAGGFREVNGRTQGGVARLMADGRLDSEFGRGPGADSLVLLTATLPDGRVVTCGGFKRFDGVDAPGLAILNADGSMPANPIHWKEWPRSAGGNGHSYAFTSRAGTWQSVREEARREGADLVSIGNEREQAFIEQSLLQGTRKLRPFWIGLSALEPRAAWAWSNGEKLRFARWAPGEPGTGSNGRWAAINLAFAEQGHDEQAFGRWSSLPRGSDASATSGEFYFGIMERDSR